MMPDNLLANVPRDSAFHFQGHGLVYTVDHLADILAICTASQFSHHINQHKNDIANWLEVVYQRPDVAKELRTTHVKDKTISILNKHIKESAKKNAHYAKTVAKKVPKDVNTRLEDIAHHIKSLESNLDTHLGNFPTTQLPAKHEFMHLQFKKGIMEFGLGLLVGIAIGLLFSSIIGL